MRTVTPQDVQISLLYNKLQDARLLLKMKLPKLPEGRTRYPSPDELKGGALRCAPMDARADRVICFYRNAPWRVAQASMDRH